MKTPNRKALVVLSGGMDSTTVLAKAVSDFGVANVQAVGFNYGQRHRIELHQAGLISEHYGLPFEVLHLPRIFAGGGSSLMEDQDVEVVGSYEELSQRFGSQPTVVPNRNMNFISMAVSYALTHGMGYVMLGVHAGDAANYHYPDCRPAFIGAMKAAIEIANEGAVELQAPFNDMSKSDIVRVAANYHAPLHLSQSCYNGARPACGTCATCLERINAFNEAGYVDPIEYAIEIDWAHPARQFPLG